MFVIMNNRNGFYNQVDQRIQSDKFGSTFYLYGDFNSIDLDNIKQLDYELSENNSLIIQWRFYDRSRNIHGTLGSETIIYSHKGFIESLKHTLDIPIYDSDRYEDGVSYDNYIIILKIVRKSLGLNPFKIK